MDAKPKEEAAVVYFYKQRRFYHSGPGEYGRMGRLPLNERLFRVISSRRAGVRVVRQGVQGKWEFERKCSCDGSWAMFCSHWYGDVLLDRKSGREEWGCGL